MKSLKVYMNNKRRSRALTVSASAAVLFITCILVKFDIVAFIKGWPLMGDLLLRILSPDIAYIAEVFGVLVETMEIAVSASLLGVIISVPLAMSVSKNACPNRFVMWVFSAVLALLRTIPSLVWAAFLVSMFSVGKFSGLMASLIIATLIGTRLFREEIDSISDDAIASVRSTGAGDLQVLIYAIIPNIRNNMISVFFVVLESCMRGASVLGLVGAGGIGQIMWRDLNLFRYDRVATIILMMLVMIYVFDFISIAVREKLNTTLISVNSIASYKKMKIAKRIIKPVFLLLLIYSIISAVGINSERFMLGLEQGKYIFSNLLRPDFGYASRMFEALMESLAIAVYATLTGAIGAFFLVGLSARNITDKKILPFIIRTVANVLRTFPPIIGAIMFFRGVGPGPFAGALALSMYTAGVLTKLYLESVESMPKTIYESLLVTGATNTQIYCKGIFPESISTFLSLALYRMESNVRNSTILGLVGAGGIGTLLSANIQWRNWNRVGLLLLGSGIMIIFFDTLSRYLRSNLTR